MQLNVREKLIQRQIMNLSQDTFIENETLTIEYESILLNDSRINIKQNNEAFSLFIKDLQLSDQRVYSLESKYLILDTSFINVLPKPQQPTVQIEHEETTITIQKTAPTEQAVQAKTTTKEIQPQPKVAVTEQQEVISAEQPKPTVETGQKKRRRTNCYDSYSYYNFGLGVFSLFVVCSAFDCLQFVLYSI
ncbi:unnamed protein product [Rotaria sp. Silwood2]|nr:unnamed protein product [Rotaria sp. Silwood2]